jgi:hypothetical protein
MLFVGHGGKDPMLDAFKALQRARAVINDGA